MNATYHIGSDCYAGTIVISKTGKRATFFRNNSEWRMHLYLDSKGKWRELCGAKTGYVSIGKAIHYLDPHF